MTEIHILPPPKRLPPSPHHWGAGVSMPADAATGRFQQREWKCQRCMLVKITVMQPGCEARREWRHADGQQFIDVVEPDCVPVIAEASRAP